LSNGERLRVAATPVSSGGSMISRAQPDIAVTVTAGDERVFFDNPYQTTATGNTNSSPASTNFFAVRGPYQRGGFGAPKTEGWENHWNVRVPYAGHGFTRAEINP